MTQSRETGMASPFLVENLDLLPKGRALDIAMGSGRNAIYLAGEGFTVEGVDISTAVVNTALKSAKEAGVLLTAKIADLEARQCEFPSIRSQSVGAVSGLITR